MLHYSQDGYLGLRCLEAKGRFLQARKRARNRLCFFSDHWGIWEQWQVVSCLLTGDACAGERELHLSPRQLPNFVWRVRVAPVGYGNKGMHAHQTGQAGPRGMCAQPPADGILDLSMRLTVGFAQRFHRRPLPAAFAVWRQLVHQRRNCIGGPGRPPHGDGVPFCSAASNASTRGKLASMHARRTQAAAFSAWRIEMRCRRRLAVLAERLKASAAVRRLRGSFLAWAGLALALDLAATRVAGKGRFIELTPNPLFDSGPRRLELQSPSGQGAPFTFPRANRQGPIPVRSI
ncbi:hypothetical protein WJX75_007228 [Coccomyxa subellipsoidea]|uniref:Uncharacterized protein n=1 Tax=Coccomyxa subellipsoidea TaxID=248742 RepID=A0ABR2YNM5_9CHLO